MTIQDYTGLYRTIQDYNGLYRNIILYLLSLPEAARAPIIVAFFLTGFIGGSAPTPAIARAMLPCCIWPECILWEQGSHTLPSTVLTALNYGWQGRTGQSHTASQSLHCRELWLTGKHIKVFTPELWLAGLKMTGKSHTALNYGLQDRPVTVFTAMVISYTSIHVFIFSKKVRLLICEVTELFTIQDCSFIQLY